ncbi:hypothetical protein Micbo1qcDRAFT_169453 [Microdochium bolleyi]|uniref:Chromo domain-containing protein n=1 Tax=Microdochium bolleyi TaxID=196109 RepID=A0A136IK88_9PEZI|nr:hypothetical protein Micbo1qcDRAFT_169453 [Microdochium bolleyi]
MPTQRPHLRVEIVVEVTPELTVRTRHRQKSGAVYYPVDPGRMAAVWSHRTSPTGTIELLVHRIREISNGPPIRSAAWECERRVQYENEALMLQYWGSGEGRDTAVCGTQRRIFRVLHYNYLTLQFLVQWVGHSSDDATWVSQAEMLKYTSWPSLQIQTCPTTEHIATTRY